MKQALILLFAGIALVTAAFFIGRWTMPKPPVPEPTVIERIDTVTVIEPRVDTVTRIKEKIMYLERIDTVTNTIIDTVTVLVPIDRYIAHKDSLYHIEATGYDVAFEEITVYPKTVTEEHWVETTVPYRWSLGIQAGYGVTFIDNKLRLAPAVTVGVSYNILSW